MSDQKIPKPPLHLGPNGRRLWRRVQTMYELAPYQLDILEAACTAADRLEEARQAISNDGLIVGHGSLNGPRAHPAVAIERDSRVALLRSLRELALSPDDVVEAPRPARIAGRYQRSGA